MIGFYRSYQKIDLKAVKRLVFICTGNICRSSFGEYIAKAKGLSAVSFGLHCRGGDGADPRAIYQADIRGIDMQHHRTRNISEYTVRKGDLILVMEPGHLLDFKRMNVEYDQISIAPLWSDKPTPYLHDPFNSNDIFFSKCESVVEQCVNNIQGFVNKEKKSFKNESL